MWFAPSFGATRLVFFLAGGFCIATLRLKGFHEIAAYALEIAAQAICVALARNKALAARHRRKIDSASDPAHEVFQMFGHRRFSHQMI